VLFTIWLILLTLITLIWGSRHLAVSRAQNRDKPLNSKMFAGPPQQAPKISVLVAAKDEQDNIESCLDTMLRQNYPNYEVVAVNDRSDDATGDILDRLAQQHGRHLRVHHVTQLREGWFGKNNAMRVAVESAEGEWFCFIDADCRQTSENTLSVAYSFARERESDFLSVLPILETRSFWERVVQPVCSAIMVMWFRPEKVNDPGSSAAYANGAFMLMKRGVYETIGGHERIKTEVNEDMHMARLAKSAGLRLFVVQNEDLYVTRMYSSLKQAWHGWSRIFYGCFASFKKLIVSILVLTIASLAPFLSLVVGLIGWWSASDVTAEHFGWIAIASAVAIAVQHSLLFRYYRLCHADRRYLPTYTLGAFIAFGMLIHAMLKQGGRASTTWRGTTYRGSQLEPR
jgi:chlorobactene glucosyltransferase